VERISPEAPVPVLKVLNETLSPGGVGNVALSLAALGADVRLVARLGSNRESRGLVNILQTHGVELTWLRKQPRYHTPVKRRLIGNQQQLLRLDEEVYDPLSPSIEADYLNRVQELLEGVDIIAISDYGKGFLTLPLLQHLFLAAKERGIQTIVDPKGVDFTRYNGATVVKPNLAEAYAASQVSSFKVPLSEVAAILLQRLDIEKLLITRSAEGMTLFDQAGRSYHSSVRSKEVKDVTGAGDTVLSALCLAYASKLEEEETLHIANVAAGIAIEHVGCAHVSMQQLAERICLEDVDSKVLDDENLFILQTLMKGRQSILVIIDKLDILPLLPLLRELKKRKSFQVIVYYKARSLDEDQLHILSSLSEIDYVVLQSQNPQNLYEVLSPVETYYLVSKEKHRLHDRRDIITALYHNTLKSLVEYQA
jgi:D-beta-D-heptose 7-phosphate kinase/D-beta-D-heptose 1-phosphate adenosyltransferase